MENPFSLEGKSLLVTGASSGIGRGVAVACAKMGAKVVLSGRNEQRLQETLALMEGEGHIVLNGDLNSEETRKEIVDKMPALNGVVYCAGISQIQMAKFMDQSSLEGIFQTNVFSPLMLNTLLLRKRKSRKTHPSSLFLPFRVFIAVRLAKEVMGQQRLHLRVS